MCAFRPVSLKQLIWVSIVLIGIFIVLIHRKPHDIEDLTKELADIQIKRDKLRKEIDSLKIIEKLQLLTGIDFFPALPESIEWKVENKIDLEKWGISPDLFVVPDLYVH